MIKVVVAGGRDFNNYKLLEDRLIKILKTKGKPSDIEIVSGGARGADALGERFAREKRCSLKLFMANWDRFGRSAGHRRNAEMADYSDVLVAFWNRASPGTKSMIELAKKKGLEVHVIHY